MAKICLWKIETGRGLAEEHPMIRKGSVIWLSKEAASGGWPVRGTMSACLHPQLCSTLCDPKDYSPPDSSAQGIPLEWVAVSSFRRSSPPRDQTHISCIGRQIHHWAAWDAWEEPQVRDQWDVCLGALLLLGHLWAAATGSDRTSMVVKRRSGPSEASKEGSRSPGGNTSRYLGWRL